MNAVIIRLLQVFVYIMFFIVLLVFTAAGFFMAEQTYTHPAIGLVGGFLIGLFNAVIFTGVIVVLIDIRTQLLRQNKV